jgi:hypothetical protein
LDNSFIRGVKTVQIKNPIRKDRNYEKRDTGYFKCGEGKGLFTDRTAISDDSDRSVGVDSGAEDEESDGDVPHARSGRNVGGDTQ